MKLRDLTGYFHLPISAASKEMNICPTALKNICRKEGLLRWPHRKVHPPTFLHSFLFTLQFRCQMSSFFQSYIFFGKMLQIKSIKRQISEKKRSLNSNNACERAQALTQIHKLEQSLANICGENVG